MADEMLVGPIVVVNPSGSYAQSFGSVREQRRASSSNVIVNPDLYEKYRVVINRENFLRVQGVLQNQDHTMSIKAFRVLPISITAAETQSHDFH